MPQIKEYVSRTETQGPIRTPRLDPTAGNPISRGLSHLGEGLAQLGDTVVRKQEQDEVSDLNAKFSAAHDEWKQTLDQKVQDGTLDVEQFKNDLAGSLGKMQEGVSTRAGDMFYKEQSTRLQSHLLQSAVQGKAQLSANKAVANFSTSLNSSSSALVNDPSSFEFVRQSNDAAVDALVATGGLPAIKAEELKLHGQKELAKSTVLGWLKANPDVAQEKLDSGEFDKYLDGTDKAQMYGLVKQQKNANFVDQQRLDAQQEKALNKKQEAIKGDFISKIYDGGTLSTKDVLNSPLDARDKEHMINLIKTASEQKSMTTNPSTFNDAFRRIHLEDGDPNKIYDDSQLLPLVGNGLTLSNLKDLRGEIMGKGTPEGAARAEARKQLMSDAKTQLVNANPMLGVKDPEGQKQLSLFYNDLIQQEAAYRKSGKPVENLYNPNHPDWAGNTIRKFAKSPEQILQGMAGQMKKGPEVGEIREGYKFIGGDPKDKKNWEKQRAVNGITENSTPSAASDRDPSDSIGFALDQLGFSGPKHDKALAEQEERRRKNREFLKGGK